MKYGDSLLYIYSKIFIGLNLFRVIVLGDIRGVNMLSSFFDQVERFFEVLLTNSIKGL